MAGKQLLVQTDDPGQRGLKERGLKGLFRFLPEV
jgi:hypothetical protein